MSKEKYVATLMKRLDALAKVAKSVTLSPSDTTALSGLLEKKGGKVYYKGCEIRTQHPSARVERADGKGRS